MYESILSNRPTDARTFRENNWYMVKYTVKDELIPMSYLHKLCNRITYILNKLVFLNAESLKTHQSNTLLKMHYNAVN